MTITFGTESDVIVYALEKILSIARENRYLFVTNCAWWITGVIELDSGQIIYIDNLETRRYLGQREVFTTTRGIARSVSADSDLRKIEEEFLLARIQDNQQPKRNTRTLRANSRNGVKKLSRRQRKNLAKQKK
jgi:hypothetical protein